MLHIYYAKELTKTCFPSTKHFTPLPGRAKKSETSRSHPEIVDSLLGVWLVAEGSSKKWK
jgi:hypothetical protein